MAPQPPGPRAAPLRGRPPSPSARLLLPLLLALSGGGRAAGEVFTTNAICRKKRCINPIFPGVEDLHRLEQATWVCSSMRAVLPSLGFCRGAVHYAPTLPILADAHDTESMVRKQDTAALTMFYYHMAGLGFEAWDYQDPANADDCVKSIWRMVCYTYFPRAQLGCEEGMTTAYLRPCQSSCQNYIRSCGVECCDESVKCVFSHTKALPMGMTMVQTGYVPHDGPSSMCTGGARRLASPSGLLWLLLVAQGAQWLLRDGVSSLAQLAGRSRALGCAALLFIAITIQGCSVEVPIHHVGNWRAEPDYLITYEFVPPGGSAHAAMLNSCSLPDLAQTAQCGGRGICRLWNEDDPDNPAAFCKCDRDYADPECGTRRKSQVVAYVLSVFFGILGADQFYLGYTIAGVFKLGTLGGFGLWWVGDIIRIGSAPVQAKNFRVASDFPHWAFVLCTVVLALMLGFTISYVTLVRHISQRRKDAMLMQAQEEARMGGPRGSDAAAVKLMNKRLTTHMPDYGSMSTAVPENPPAFAPPQFQPMPPAQAQQPQPQPVLAAPQFQPPPPPPPQQPQQPLPQPQMPQSTWMREQL